MLGAVVVTVTASGSVGDYADTTNIKLKLAAVAGIDASLIDITVAAASAFVTATVAVPSSTTAQALAGVLSAALSTAAAAYSGMGLEAETVPTVEIVMPPPPASLPTVQSGAHALSSEPLSASGSDKHELPDSLIVPIATVTLFAMVPIVTLASVLCFRLRRRRVGAGRPHEAATEGGDEGGYPTPSPTMKRGKAGSGLWTARSATESACSAASSAIITRDLAELRAQSPGRRTMSQGKLTEAVEAEPKYRAARFKARKAELTAGDEFYEGAKGTKEGPGRSVSSRSMRVEASALDWMTGGQTELSA